MNNDEKNRDKLSINSTIESDENIAKDQFEKMSKQFKYIDASEVAIVGVSKEMTELQKSIRMPLEGIRFNALTELSASILRISKVMTELQKSIRMPLEGITFNALTELSSSTLGISKVMTELQKSIRMPLEGIKLNAFTEFSTSILGISKVMTELQKSIRMPLEGIKLNAFTEFSTSTLGISKVMTELQKSIRIPLEGIKFSAFTEFNASALGISRTIAELQNNLRKQFEHVNLSGIRFNENGTISYLDEIVDFNDTIQEVNDCINSDLNLEQKTVKILQGIKSKHPIIIFIIITFILYPFYAYYVDCAKVRIGDAKEAIISKYLLSSDKNKIAKVIKSEVKNKLNVESDDDLNFKAALIHYRLVEADCLNVRISNSTKSKILYTISFGQVVKVLDKNKEWVLIEYNDNNICIKGWVFSKYISTFN